MGVRTAGDNPHPLVGTAFGQRLGVPANLLGVLLEFRLQQLIEQDAPGCQHVALGAALKPREYRAVDFGAQLGELWGAVFFHAVRDLHVLTDQDHAATPGPPKGLLGGKGDHMGIGHRAGNRSTGDQAAVVGAIYPKVGAHLVTDLPKCLVVDEARIGGGAHTDQLGLVLQSHLPNLVHVDHLGLPADPVVQGVVGSPAVVELGPVAQVTAVVQGQAQEGIARLQKGPQHRHVGNGGVAALDVGVIHAEGLFHPLHRQQLRLVCQLTAAYKPLSSIALGVLIGEHGALQAGGHGGDHVFRGDQADGLELPLFLSVQKRCHLRIKNIQQFNCILFGRGRHTKNSFQLRFVFIMHRHWGRCPWT